MRILPAEFVRAFTPNIINLHPALLPFFPGAHAVRDALAAGVSETGSTVHIVDEGVDTGPVIRQLALAVDAGDDESSLHEKIKQIERPLLVETVGAIARGDINLKDLVSP
jgi:phosphoribosylglycinamide formyltransferase-1